MPTVAPFGRWPSPLGADAVAAGRVSLSELHSDGHALYWLEGRPSEGGRVVLVRCHDGEVDDHSPTGVSIRSKVHEYGGGAVCLVPQHHDGSFAYVDQADQRVWFCDGPTTTPYPLTAEPPAGTRWHHGGLSASADGQWVLAVREAHLPDAGDEHPAPKRSIIAVPVGHNEATAFTLLSGDDFYGTARLNPAGDRLVATAWDHPDMPWDASRVVITAVQHDAGQLRATGDPWEIPTAADESVGQPAWRPDGTLRFVSDREGWWQPYVHSGRQEGPAPQRLTDLEAEFHGPDWNLSQRTMADLPDGSLVARMTQDGRDSLVIFPPGADVPDQPPLELDQPCANVLNVIAHGEGIAYIGATADEPTAIYLRPATPQAPTATARRPDPTNRQTLTKADIAVATPIHLTGRSGRTIHANLYRPTLASASTHPPLNEQPPLIVFCHSGPTTNTQQGYDPAIQFFTTRGFAVATPDYAGSTGYGRRYREALNGQWGVADAHDCLDTALHFADTSAVDPTRMAVRGTSAGGFTALNALAAGEGFAAGVSWYGVTDLLTLVATTHDFEAHYTDRLIGPLPATAALYEERSPRTHAAAMTGAVLLLQGADDPVVPLSQAQQLHDALRAAGRICELHIFEGEGHGFRRAGTLMTAYEMELAFYRTHLRL